MQASEMTGADLRRWRDGLGWSRRELAEKCRVATITVAHWEREFREDVLADRLRELTFASLARVVRAH